MDPAWLNQVMGKVALLLVEENGKASVAVSPAAYQALPELSGKEVSLAVSPAADKGLARPWDAGTAGRE